MNRLIRAEFLKLRTTQVWFWLLMGTIAVSGLLIVAQLAPSDGVRHPHQVPDMFTSSSTSFIVVFVLGALAVTTEFRYQTITPTVLQTPSRWAIVTAKMITYLILGAIFALVAIVVQIAIAVPWLSSKNVTVDFGNGHVQHALIGVFAVVAIFGIIGLGVGALVRNQIVAVVVGILFLAIFEHLLLLIPGVRNAWPYMPGAASAAIWQTTGDDTANGVHLLSTWAGVGVLLAWAFIPAFLGAVYSMNRDIT
jgi:hypothetical protein